MAARSRRLGMSCVLASGSLVIGDVLPPACKYHGEGEAKA